MIGENFLIEHLNRKDLTTAASAGMAIFGPKISHKIKNHS